MSKTSFGMLGRLLSTICGIDMVTQSQNFTEKNWLEYISINTFEYFP